LPEAMTPPGWTVTVSLANRTFIAKLYAMMT